MMLQKIGGYWILDAHGEPTPATFVTWCTWYETADRTVARTDVGVSRVSTVFLGLDHAIGGGPPVLWETLIFGGLLDGDGDRYRSRAAALEGHAHWVAAVLALTV